MKIGATSSIEPGAQEPKRGATLDVHNADAVVCPACDYRECGMVGSLTVR
jgi:hypothetical protein